MRRKVFSLMMMLLLAVTGFVRAEIVEIGDGTSTTYYVPFNSLYNYSFTEQVFLASEIGTAGTITSISFNLGQSSTADQINDYVVYMKHVTRENFASATDIEPVTAGDIVFQGQWTIPANYTGWIVLNLDTPFFYDGSSNLLIAMDENTGSYSTRYFTYTSVTNSSISFYSDSYNPDPYDLDGYSGSKAVRNYRSNIQLDITPGGGTLIPEENEITLHDGSATNGYVPVYGFYADAYLKSEMVYPASELTGMIGADIHDMTFYATQSSVSWGAANFRVFLAEAANTSINAFAGPGTVVYEGPLSVVGGEMVVSFNTPYRYNGGNLLVGFYNTVTGGYVTSTWYGESVEGASYQGYSYSSLSEITGTQRNFLPKTNFAYTSYIVAEPGLFADLDLGYRPNGAWMRPYVAQLTAIGVNETAVAMESTNSFFTVNAELPAPINSNSPIDFTIDHGTATAGPVNGELVVITENRGAYTLPMTAVAYNPIANDVIETATTATFNNGLFTASVGADMYDNYLLPGDAEDGKDAAYKIQVNEEKLLSVYVGGNNPKWAVYTDFNGQPGPGVDNYYVGPAIGEGGSIGGNPFNVQIGEGTSTTGYFPFYTLYNYSIAECLFLASELEEAGVTTTPMASLSWYATNAPGYLQKGIKIWMANVSDTELTTTSHSVNGMTLVFDDNNMGMTPEIGWNEFVFNQAEFAWDGQSNILIFVQRNNGEWNSTVSWQATTGSAFNAMAYQYQDGSAYDPTIANTMYTSTTRPNTIFKSTGRRNQVSNRDQFTYNFDAGLQGWTSIDADGDGHGWIHSSQNEGGYDYSTLGHNGSSGFAMSASFVDYVGPFDADNYLVSPQKYFIAPGSNLQFFADYGNDDYPDYFEVCVSTAATPAANNFTTIWSGYAKEKNAAKAEVRNLGKNRYENWQNHIIDLSDFAGQEIWIAFRHNDYDMYELWIDDVTVNAAQSGGGEPGGGGSQWELGAPLTLVPGTYYLVASSTDNNFDVMATLTDLPLPVAASDPHPADGAVDITSPVTLRWTLGQYTTEYRVLFGTTYPPEVVVDWTSDLAESLGVGILYNNKNYFWRVDERNSSGETLGQLWGFTTTLNIPQNLSAVAEKIYEGDVLTLNWASVGDRSHRGYNIYMDGVKLNSTPVTATTYNVEGLTYNMAPGYVFNVTAVYDEGESAFSGDLVVFVTGNGFVNGTVYENDGVTPIAGATVTFIGVDEFQRLATAVFTTNAAGYYNGNILAGVFAAVASKDGYQDALYQGVVEIAYSNTTNGIDIIMNENWIPVAEVIAEEVNADLVKVYWSQGIMSEVVEDFETGDFSAFPWVNNSAYPWEITTISPYEGNYCMMSGNFNVASSSSVIEISYDIPYEGLMSFFGKISCESSWDYGYFYIDGVEKASFTGLGNWVEKEFPITEGVHTFKWEYTKDGSVNSNDDRFYVDYISFFHHAEPTPPGLTVFDFDDSSMQGWTAIDADGDGWNWDIASNVMSTGYGHNGSNDCVLSQSYNNTAGVLYPDNYLVSPQVTLGGTFQFYACAQDNLYAAEHFGVAVSTTNNTSAAAFTTIQEWTMSAKDGGAFTKETRSGSREQGNWYLYTVDLSSYAGQTGYVAIRHFNCSDMFYLDVDDIGLNNGSKNFAPDFADNFNSVHNMYPAVNAPRYRRNAAVDRSFDHFNVYRTSCYDETGEEAELIAQVNDTVYMDVAWATLEPGVYKWGVSRVYEGIHETKINWGKPVHVDPNAEASPMAPVHAEVTRAPWDVLAYFTGTSAGQQAVATDGDFIYTASWQATPTGGYTFYKYDLAGNFIEGFDIAGATGIRDLTYDGQYFYGTSGGASIFELDLVNKTLVSTITCSGLTSRHISYDPVRDGFWSGNWTTMALYSRSGALIETGTAPASAYGSAYYMDEDNVEHLYLFCQPNSDALVYDYNIATGTINGPVFDFANIPGYDPSNGIAGGCFVADYNGKTAFFGNVQASPNLIGICELRENVGPLPPTPPTPGTEGESDIVWSNCLDHNMNQQVSLSVSTNSGDNVEGAVVSLVNISEPELAITYNVTLDESGYYVWDSFRRGVYNVTITLDGYTPIEETVEVFYNNALVYVLEEIVGNLDNLYVSATGWVIMGEVTPGSSGPNPPVGPGSTFNENFDTGMPAGWTTVDADGDGYTWVSSMNPGNYHNSGVNLEGTGHNASAHYVISGSYANATGQVLYPDNYLVTPQVTIANGSTFSFFACAQDNLYAAEHFGVAVSDNGTSNWTMLQEWTLTAKGASNVMSAGRSGNTRAQGNWYNFTVDLSAYAGQKYVAIRHFNCSDQFILNVDDIQLNSGRGVQQYLVRLDGALDGVTTMPFFQHNVDNLVPGSAHTTSVKAVYGTGESDWATFDWVYTPCDEFAGLQEDPHGEMDGADVVLSWVLPEGTGPTPPPTGGEWYYYDNGINEDAIGTNGGEFWWAVMFPAGSYTGNMVTKVAAWDYMAMGGDVTIYNDGASAPSTPVGTTGVTLTGSEDFVEFEFAAPVAIDPSKNVWVVFHNASGATHPAAACANTGDPNGRWVSTDNVAWDDLATFGLDYTFMVRAYIASGKTGEVTVLTTEPQTAVEASGTFSNAGVAKVRAPWDLMMTFQAAEAGQYGIAYDGNNFYTSNWGYTSAVYNFYKYDLQGNMIEGFDIPGCGTLRGMTYDGEFFYGVANAPTVYCVDLANHTLVNSFTTSYGAMRGITYDPERDGFWVIGNWSGNLTLIDRNGTVQFVGPEPASASDLAYYKDENGVEHVFCFNNSDNGVYDYNITTNTLGGSVFNFSAVPGYDAGSAGGCNVAVFNGKTAFMGNIQQSPNLIGIYELSEGTGPVPPVPPVVGGIVGVEIFRDGEWIAEVPYTENTYVDVNPGNFNEYTIRVVHDGNVEDWTYYAMSCPEVVNFGAPTCVAPENLSGRYHWDPQAYGAIVNWTYGEAPHGDEFFYDFENGSMSDWTTIDADGDGKNWALASSTMGTGYGYNGSSDMVFSQSYDNNTGVLYPDNYLVSRQVALGGVFSFYACAQDNLYAAEHFGVAISTSGNTSASSFTTIQEWTMTAKEGVPTDVTRNGGRAQGTWYQFSVDLSSYAGQTGYIAIRHFNCNDMFYLDVDNISLGAGKRAGNPVSFNIYRDGAVVGNVPFNGDYEYSYFDEVSVGIYDYQVTAVYDGCESDFALIPDGTANFLTIDVNAVAEDNLAVNVYPNPTNGNVKIEAAGMNHLTVVSALGQILFDADVNGDNFEMNLGQYNAGIYMVRIFTENGVAVRRVTVVE